MNLSGRESKKTASRGRVVIRHIGTEMERQIPKETLTPLQFFPKGEETRGGGEAKNREERW